MVKQSITLIMSSSPECSWDNIVLCKILEEWADALSDHLPLHCFLWMHVPDKPESPNPDGGHFSHRFLKINQDDLEVKAKYHTALEEQMSLPDITTVASAAEAEYLVNSHFSSLVQMMHAAAETTAGAQDPV